MLQVPENWETGCRCVLAHRSLEETRRQHGLGPVGCKAYLTDYFNMLTVDGVLCLATYAGRSKSRTGRLEEQTQMQTQTQPGEYK